MKGTIALLAALSFMPALAMAQGTDSTQRQHQSQPSVSQDTMSRGGEVARDSTKSRTRTAHHRRHSHVASDSATSNQNQSGYTNTQTGKSTLGPGVKKTSPTAGSPVTAKGDTLKKGNDSTAATPPR